MRRSARVLVLGALALALFAGAAQADKLRIGIHRQAFGSTDVVAWKKGYFDAFLGKDNYSIHFFSRGAHMNQALLSGSLDTGTSGFVPWATGVARGGKVVGFAVTAHLCGLTRLMVRPDSPIRRVGDLKGKAVATGKGGSNTFTFLHFILPAHGLSAEDVTIVNTTNVERLPALRAGTADAMVVIEPTASIAEAKGYARNLVENFCPYHPDAMVSIVHPKALGERRAQVVSYLRAWLKAQEYYRSDFEGYVRLYHEHQVSMGTKVEVSVTREALKRLIFKPDLSGDIRKSFQRVVGLLKKQGTIRRTPDFAGKGENLDLGLLREARGRM